MARDTGGARKSRRGLGRQMCAGALMVWIGTGMGLADEVSVDNSSFRCMSDMTQVRHFYVDNLLGNLDGTVKVAQAGKGVYPPGSLLQLIPFEAMVKRQKGFNPATNDWEFFFLDVDAKGTNINTRGFAEVNNGFGMNCFGCYAMAKPEFDMVCEQDNGCDPIPLTREMFGALQRTDPRCESAEPVTKTDQQALAQIEGALQALIESQKK